MTGAGPLSVDFDLRFLAGYRLRALCKRHSTVTRAIVDAVITASAELAVLGASIAEDYARIGITNPR